MTSNVPDMQEVVGLLKQVAEGVLVQKRKVAELEARLARLEHVQTVAKYELPPPIESILYAQRDIIGE